MMKQATYFSHDDNAASDPKVKAMMSRFGVEGYGRFWLIVEMLATTDGNRLPFGGYIWNALAMHMQCTSEQAREFVEFCIAECQLFTSDGVDFWSESLNRRVERRRELADKKRKAAEKRWSDRDTMQTDADAMQMHARAMHNDAKESKVKERKERREREKETRERGVEPDPATTTTTPPPTFTQGIPNDSPFNPQLYPPSVDVVIEHGAKMGRSAEDCRRFHDHYASQGWTKGNNRPITDWLLVLRIWTVDNDAGLAPKRKGATGGNAGRDDRVAKPLSQEAAISECSRTGRTLTELPRLKNRNGRAEYVSWFERSYAIPNTHEPWPWEVPS